MCIRDRTDTIQAVSGSMASVPLTIDVVASSRTVVVSPAAAAVPAGAALQFITAAGCAGTIWQVNLNGNSGNPGSITNGATCGLYTAPLSPPASGTVTISAFSGGSSGTSTVTILFSNASLNSLVNQANPRPYAFSYLGDNASGFLTVAGTFAADGNGNITGGTEDVNSGFAAPTMSTFAAGSTYTAVSYTHLDVYKRQTSDWSRRALVWFPVEAERRKCLSARTSTRRAAKVWIYFTRSNLCLRRSQWRKYPPAGKKRAR